MIGNPTKPAIGDNIDNCMIYIGDGFAVHHHNGTVYRGQVGFMVVVGFKIELPTRPGPDVKPLAWRRWAEKCRVIIKALQGV